MFARFVLSRSFRRIVQSHPSHSSRRLRVLRKSFACSRFKLLLSSVCWTARQHRTHAQLTHTHSQTHAYTYTRTRIITHTYTYKRNITPRAKHARTQLARTLIRLRCTVRAAATKSTEFVRIRMGVRLYHPGVGNIVSCLLSRSSVYLSLLTVRSSTHTHARTHTAHSSACPIQMQTKQHKRPSETRAGLRGRGEREIE